MALEVAEAKLARTSAKRVFNRNVKKIVDSINSKDTAALIESRFKDLKQLWDDVQRKHEGYVESLENSKMTPEGKVQLLKEKQACWSCLKIGHRSIDCRQRKKCNSDDCSKYHHDSLHVAHVQGVAFHIPYFSRPNSDADGKESRTCLLQVMKVKSAVNASSLNVLWDGGATISLITFAKARELSLDGEEIHVYCDEKYVAVT